MSSGPPWLRGLARALVAVSLALALAVGATWPLPLDPTGAVVGEKMGVSWALGLWAGHLPLRELLRPELAWLGFPGGGPVVLVALPQVLLTAALDGLVGPTLAFNLSQWLHLAAGVLAVARLARVLDPGPPGAAATAAALATGCTVGLSCGLLSSVGNGQPENLGVAYLALAALGAVRLVRDGRALGAVWLALGTALTFLSSPYLLMGPLLGAPVLALPWLRRAPRRVALAGVVLVLVTLPFVRHFRATTEAQANSALCPAVLEVPSAPRRLPWHQVRQALAATPPKGDEQLVADPARLLRPGRRAPDDDHLAGDYLGWVPVLMALAGAWASPAARWALLAWLPALVLSLGPGLVVHGWWLTLPGDRLLVLPLAGLQALPGVGSLFHAVQVPVRLLFGGALFLAAAGLPAWRALGGRLARSPAGLPLLVVLCGAPAAEQLLVGPAAPPMPMTSTVPRAAHLALARQPDRLALLETPALGWDPARPSFIGPRDQPIPPPFKVARDLAAGHVVHGRPLALMGCARDSLLHPVVVDSDFAAAVTDLLVGVPPRQDLGRAAAPLVAVGFGWYAVHTGTGQIRPEAEARLVQAARQELELVEAGADGSYLFRLPTAPGEGDDR